MTKLEMFVNGNFADGEEVYQIGTTNKDGSTQLRIRQRTLRLNEQTPLSKLQTFLLEADNQATNLSIQQTLFN